MPVVSPADVRLSLFRGRSFHLDGDDGLIVKGLDPFGVIGNSGEDGINQLFGAAMRLFPDDLLQALTAEEIAFGACGVENPVAKEKKDVARMPGQIQLIVRRIREQSYR